MIVEESGASDEPDSRFVLGMFSSRSKAYQLRRIALVSRSQFP
jgi:hypothetical protein